MEIYVYPIIALLFVGIFTREVIAPVSRNHCDRRWLIMASSLGVATVIITLFIGYVMADMIRENALFNASVVLPDVIVGILSFWLTSFVFYWWHRATQMSGDWIWGSIPRKASG
jgi:sterol desaturase/sphingolipid hydroxylase (fatty acid hydroxylase superfamily)